MAFSTWNYSTIDYVILIWSIAAATIRTVYVSKV